MSGHGGAKDVRLDTASMEDFRAIAREAVTLRQGIEALAGQLDREADQICPVGHYDKKDKAWRVAHVRRRVADDLRKILADVLLPDREQQP